METTKGLHNTLTPALTMLLALQPLLLPHTPACAQGNDRSAPTGGRSALMGNTGVALAHDGAAPFLNPATIVRIEDQRLAFSVNFYSFGFTHFSDWHQPGAVDTSHYPPGNLGGTGLTSNSLRVLPSTLCLFFTLSDVEKMLGSDNGGQDAHEDGHTRDGAGHERLPRKKLAICFATLESEDVGLQAVHFQGTTPSGITSQVQSLSRRWSRAYLGPTYSVLLSHDLAVGGSLQGAYTYDSFGFSSNSVIAQLGGGGVTGALGASGSGFSFDLVALLGATYRHGDMTYGASLQTPSLHLFGSYSATYNQSSSGAAGESSVLASGSGSLNAAPPIRVAVGAGWQKPGFTLEADAAFDIPYAKLASSTMDVTTNTVGAANGQGGNAGVTTATVNQTFGQAARFAFTPSVGGEYFVSPQFSLLGGLGANLTSLGPLTPAPSLGNLVQARTSHATVSGGIGSYGGGGELLFGAQLDYGWGQALAANPYVVPNDWAVVSSQSYSMMLIVAGATDLRTIKRAVEHVKNAVTTGDPETPSTHAGATPR